MKLAIAAVAALAATAAARPAAACGVPDFSEYAAALADALSTRSKPVHTPLLIVGGGGSTEGAVASVSAGYGWGTKEEGFLAATTIQRILLGIRSDGTQTAVSATYGWYVTGMLGAGFDVGIETEKFTSGEQMSGTRGLGPTGRLTLGANGVSLRLTGGASFGNETRAVGAAELMLDVMDLGNVL